MSTHQAFRRTPVPQQFAQNLQTVTLPAPTRGIVQSENDAYMAPGGAIVQDNWVPTMRGVKLRGGTQIWCDCHQSNPTWSNNHAYAIADRAYDSTNRTTWQCAVNHTSALSGTFAADRAAHSTYWTQVVVTRKPVISAFEYTYAGSVRKMFAGQQDRLLDVTAQTPIAVVTGQTSGNYASAQFQNSAGGGSGTNWLIAVNDAGDYPLRFNGTTWVVLDASGTTWTTLHPYAIGDRAIDSTDNSVWRCTFAHTSGSGTFAADRAAHPTYWSANASDGAPYFSAPVGTTPFAGHGLTYVWKYRGRLFFVEGGTMNAWYGGINAIGGALTLIPLAGSCSKGGSLLFGAVWSLDAGDGIDDKCVFVTTEGEVLIFTGSNPADPANWRQEGRYALGRPMGMNAHLAIGGDLLIATVDGIVPVSAAIQKDAGQLELAMISRNVKPTWRIEALTKQTFPWTIKRWDAYGAIFVTWPGGLPGNRYCALINSATGAWARFLGYDALCFVQMHDDFFFGTQDGTIMQCERTGSDDGKPYVATLVGGWEMFQAPSNVVVWHQARAVFSTSAAEPFQPQIDSTTDYIITLPPPPPAGPDPGILEVWDVGVWDDAALWKNLTPYAIGNKIYGEDSKLFTCAVNHTSAGSGNMAADRVAHPTFWTATTQGTVPTGMHWDMPAPPRRAPIRNTMWVSVGKTGFAHAPICQVTIAQLAAPDVELLAIAATFERAGVNV